MNKLALMMAAVAALAGCGGGGAAAPTPAPIPSPTPTPNQSPLAVDLSKFQTCARPNCNPNWVSELHIDEWFWSSGTIHDETVMAIASSDGGAPRYALWRPPASSADVLQVSRWTDGAVLTPGVDYTISNAQISIPAGSSVQLAPHDFPFVSDPTSQYADREFTKSGTPLLIGDYSSRQLQVTYRPATLPNEPQVFGSLPKFQAKLASCAPMAITLYGDSISQVGRYPFLSLIAAYLEQRCPGAVHYRNQSVGGYASDGAAANADAQLNDTASDLVIVAFGVNDAGQTPRGKTAYSSNIATVMLSVRARAPETEFLLVAGAEGNADWVAMDAASFPGYQDALNALAGAGVAAVDITDVWHDVIANKTYYDVTMNGVNHPNDWGLLIYAQALLRAMGAAP